MPLFIETRTDAARPAAARFFCTFGAVLPLLSFLQFSWEDDTSFNRFSDEKFECPVEACDHFDYFLSKCCFTLLGTFVLLCTAWVAHMSPSATISVKVSLLCAFCFGCSKCTATAATTEVPRKCPTVRSESVFHTPLVFPARELRTLVQKLNKQCPNWSTDAIYGHRKSI